MTLLWLGLLILAIGALGVVMILALTLTWRRHQRRLGDRPPSRVQHLDAWRMAGARYRGLGEEPHAADNPVADHDDDEGRDDHATDPPRDEDDQDHTDEADDEDDPADGGDDDDESR